MTNRNFLRVGVLALLLESPFAFSMGYEKPIMVSGKYGGLEGAAASSVSTPEALLLNPAGLASVQDTEAQVDFSPFLAWKSGPVQSIPTSATVGAPAVSAHTSFIPSFGVFSAKRINDKLGIGIGVSTPFGTGGTFGNISYGPGYPALQPEVAGMLAVGEFSLGAGYEVLPGLRLGAAWRITYVNSYAKLGLPIVDPTTGTPIQLDAIEFNNMTDVEYGGFRFGAQYEPDSHTWGLGAVFRTSVTFTATGASTFQTEAAGSSTVNSGYGNTISQTSTLPWQVGFGGHYDVATAWRLFLQYDFTHYSSNQVTTYSGDAVAGLPASTFNRAQNWHDMHGVRLASEYHVSPEIALRGGLGYFTQVTNTNAAYVSMLPPGPVYDLSAGAGFALNDRTQFDFAADYGFAFGVGANSTLGFLDGDYSAKALTFHLGLNYRL